MAWLSKRLGTQLRIPKLGAIGYSLVGQALLARLPWHPALSAVGTFLITWSFFFTTPGVVTWSLSTDPIAWNLTGEFLFKDVVLLCVCLVLLRASIERRGDG